MNHVVEKPTVGQLACDIDECIHRDREADHGVSNEADDRHVGTRAHVEATSTISPERRVCEKLLVLLHRQRRERVASSLVKLQAELGDACVGPGQDIPTCQLGHALSKMAYGHHDEARALLTELARMATDNEFVAANAMLALSHIGEVRAARDLAFDLRERFSHSTLTLRNATQAFENCLDLAEASATASRELEIVTAPDVAGEIREKLWLYSELQWFGNERQLNSESFLAYAEFAIQTLKNLGRKIHRIEFTGPFEAMSLDFFVNASSSVVHDDAMHLAEAQWSQPEGQLLSEIMMCDIRALDGRIRRPLQTTVETGANHGIA